MTKFITRLGIINYLYGYVQIYWVFILSSLSLSTKDIATVITISYLTVVLASWIYSRYRPKLFKGARKFIGVSLVGSIETIILIMTGIAIWNNNVVLSIIGLILIATVNQIKVLELKYNVLVTEDTDAVGIFNIQHQVSVELGWGTGSYLIGILITILKANNSLVGYQIMSISIFIAGILSLIYTILIYLTSRKSQIYVTGLCVKHSSQDRTRISKLKRFIPAVPALLVTLLMTIINGSEESISSYYINKSFSNSEELFGIMTLTACMCGVILLKLVEYHQTRYMKKLEDSNKDTNIPMLRYNVSWIIISLSFILIGYSLLKYTPLTMPTIIIYASLLSGVSLIYSTLPTVLNKTRGQLTEAEVVGIGEVVSSLGYTLAPYLIFYTMIEYQYGIVIAYILGIIVVITCVNLIKNRRQING